MNFQFGPETKQIFGPASSTGGVAHLYSSVTYEFINGSKYNQWPSVTDGESRLTSSA